MIQKNKSYSIAIVGTGVSGLSTAYILSQKHRVTLFEKNTYLGGHTNTIEVEEGSQVVPVDTGFIVFNDRNYPTFIKLLSRLGIKGQSSDMSFGFHDENTGLCYSSYVPEGLFAQKKNYFSPRFLGMVRDILRFNQRAKEDLETDRLDHQTLGEYLAAHNYGNGFKNYYLLPMGAAIWSTPTSLMLDFPAKTFLRFFDNHGLLQLKDRPHWRTVPGGSYAYIKAMKKQFKGDIFLEAPIDRVERKEDRVIITSKNRKPQDFDYVVIAAHADEAYQMLAKPTEDETELLSPWQYNQNEAVLHTDQSVLPKNKRAWASWNYHLEKGEQATHVSLTYDMNRLQSLETQKQYLVTLNRKAPIAEEKIIRRIRYTHPMYTSQSVGTQAHLHRLNGKTRVLFCGSYFGYGFHEDAVKSANDVLAYFGETI